MEGFCYPQKSSLIEWRCGGCEKNEYALPVGLKKSQGSEIAKASMKALIVLAYLEVVASFVEEHICLED